MSDLAPYSFAKARPTELCQLAGRWAGVMPDAAGAMVERKYDGFRCLFFYGLDGQPGLWTRGGMPMPGAGHILARLLEIEEAMGGRWMIDGEFVVDGTLAATNRVELPPMFRWSAEVRNLVKRRPTETTTARSAARPGRIPTRPDRPETERERSTRSDPIRLSGKVGSDADRQRGALAIQGPQRRNDLHRRFD